MLRKGSRNRVPHSHCIGFGGCTVKNSETKVTANEQNSDPMKENYIMSGAKVGKLAQLGAIATAVLASTCCWLPLLLIALGISVGTISATIAAWRWVILPITFVFLAVAFYFTYRRPKFTAEKEYRNGIEGDAAD